MKDEGTGGTSAQIKTKVFISYSRRDMAWADWIVDALQKSGVEALIDREDIEKGEDFQERIFSLINQADTVIYLITPNSVSSKFCDIEVDYAESLNKRFVPLLLQPVSDAQGRPLIDANAQPLQVPNALARINWVPFNEGSDANASMGDLLNALLTDLQWVREHTRLGEHALRWQKSGSPASQLMRGKDLEAAEQWRDSHPKNARPPTELQLQFVAASRKGSGKRRNLLVGSLMAGLVLAVGLGVLVTIQMKEVERQRTSAIRSLAKNELSFGDPIKAAQLAVKANDTWLLELSLRIVHSVEISAPFSCKKSYDSCIKEHISLKNLLLYSVVNPVGAPPSNKFALDIPKSGDAASDKKACQPLSLVEKRAFDRMELAPFSLIVGPLEIRTRSVLVVNEGSPDLILEVVDCEQNKSIRIRYFEGMENLQTIAFDKDKGMIIWVEQDGEYYVKPENVGSDEITKNIESMGSDEIIRSIKNMDFDKIIKKSLESYDLKPKYRIGKLPLASLPVSLEVKRKILNMPSDSSLDIEQIQELDMITDKQIIFDYKNYCSSSNIRTRNSMSCWNDGISKQTIAIKKGVVQVRLESGKIYDARVPKSDAQKGEYWTLDEANILVSPGNNYIAVHYTGDDDHRMDEIYYVSISDNKLKFVFVVRVEEGSVFHPHVMLLISGGENVIFTDVISGETIRQIGGSVSVHGGGASVGQINSRGDWITVSTGESASLYPLLPYGDQLQEFACADGPLDCSVN